MPLGVLDHVAVQVGQRSSGSRAKLRCDILVAEEAHIARVATWFIGKYIRLTGVGGGAKGVPQCAVDTDADEVSLWQRRGRRVAYHLLLLR